VRHYLDSAQMGVMLADSALIPGLSDLPAKLLSQCGLVSAVLIVAVVWLALQLAKARDGWEKDRAGMLKMMAEQNSAYDKIAISHAKIEAVLFSMHARGIGDD
jgi:hypothetical protein